MRVLQNRTSAQNANPNVAPESCEPKPRNKRGFVPLREARGTADERQRGPLGAERMRGGTLAKQKPSPRQPLRAEQREEGPSQNTRLRQRDLFWGPSECEGGRCTTHALSYATVCRALYNTLAHFLTEISWSQRQEYSLVSE